MKKGSRDGGLNELPEEVILHILSFLPARTSAQTSILARKWRFLWAQAPLSFDLHFREWDFRGLYQLSSLLHNAKARRTVLDIKTLGLSCSDDSFSTGHPSLDLDLDLDKLFSALVHEHNLRNLDISVDLSCRDHPTLPLCIFDCKTLVDARLGQGVDIPTPADFVSLPRLKKLHLDLDMEFPYGAIRGDLSHLLSGCPVLEELVLEGTPGPCLEGCTIASTTLKRLTVNFRDILGGFGRIEARQLGDFGPTRLDRKVIVNAPALEYLEMNEQLCELISPTHSLIEARIVIFVDADPGVTRCVLKLLDSLCFVESLTFLCSTWDEHNKNNFEDYMEEVGKKNVRFDRLRRLEFDAPWRFLFKFLESVHHLQVLVIPKIEGFSEEEEEQWVEPLQVPKCLSSHVTSIKVAHFEQREDEFELLSYLLRNAQVLERMEIHYSPCREDVQTDHSETN